MWVAYSRCPDNLWWVPDHHSDHLWLYSYYSNMKFEFVQTWILINFSRMSVSDLGKHLQSYLLTKLMQIQKVESKAKGWWFNVHHQTSMPSMCNCTAIYTASCNIITKSLWLFAGLPCELPCSLVLFAGLGRAVQQCSERGKTRWFSRAHAHCTRNLIDSCVGPSRP